MTLATFRYEIHYFWGAKNIDDATEPFYKLNRREKFVKQFLKHGMKYLFPV